ncbi:TetR/AcrR family transcriptional regulator [Companilactobacillus furfuricola]|uniref:TetR/AcrR family transcriptional regulator n=1 Tax=Companilactobacillus furfuricola TaxID=1462575 RepID=UPI0013DDC75A|nr:TetR/AcrR family transcriptional regulator [Companilactobacillus furfuricola]
MDSNEMPKGKRQVILAAMKLFANQGFDGTSTQQIAQESGMSQATIFKYFKTKEDLLRWIVSPIIQNVFPIYIDEFKRRLGQEHSNLRELIHFIVRDRYRFLIENNEVAWIVISSFLTKVEIQDKVKSLFSERAPEVVGLFREMLDRTGEVRDDIDTLAVVRMMVSQIVIYFLQTDKLFPGRSEELVDADLKEIEDLVYRAVCRG